MMRIKKAISIIGISLLLLSFVACNPEQAEQNVKEFANDLAHANGDRTLEGMKENREYFDKKAIYNDAKAAVEQEIDCPSTAVYPAFDDSFVTKNDDGTWNVVSYVDAQNLMGAMVRIKYQVVIKYSEDGSEFTYWFIPL